MAYPYYGIATGTTVSNDYIWKSWATVYATPATAITTSSTTDYIWKAWGSGSYVTGGAATTADIIWNRWGAVSIQPTGMFRAETQEERIAREASAREAARIRQEAAEARLAKDKVAREKARALLKRFLSKEQDHSLDKHGYFFVDLPDGSKFRIDQGRSRNVKQVDKEGRIILTYCAHPAENIPDEDTMLAQMLHLKYDQDTFFRVANRS